MFNQKQPKKSASELKQEYEILQEKEKDNERKHFEFKVEKLEQENKFVEEKIASLQERRNQDQETIKDLKKRDVRKNELIIEDKDRQVTGLLKLEDEILELQFSLRDSQLAHDKLVADLNLEHAKEVEELQEKLEEQKIE